MNTLTLKQVVYRLLSTLLTAIVLFHFCIIFKLIPYNIAWGGRLENDNQMYVFEAVSILINSILIVVLFLKNKKITQRISDRILNVILWFYLSVFLLNTIGNIFAKTNFEKFFAILTFLFSLLIWVILKKDKQNVAGISI